MEKIKSQIPKPNDYIHRRANARLNKCLGIIYKSLLSMVPKVSASSEEMQEHADAHGSSVVSDACICFPDYGLDGAPADGQAHHPIRHALIAMIVAYNEHNGMADIASEDIKHWRRKYYARARSMAFTDISDNLIESLKALIQLESLSIQNKIIQIKEIVEDYE